MSTYLITQATGQQGQHIVKHLLAAGVNVHALVRDLQKVPEILKQSGVTLFQGESKNFEEVFQAAKGCKGAYLNTVPFPGLEALQARTIVEASKKAGVETIVACTTVRTNDKSFWDNSETEECGVREYYISKAEVEDIVRGASFKSYTILRPAVLLQDFLLPGVHYNFPSLAINGILDHPFEDGVRSPFTDADDVGKYAAAALIDPAKFRDQEIDLNNEALTIEQVHDILIKVSGKNVGLRKRTPEEIEEAKATVFGQRFSLLANKKDFGATGVAAKDVSAKYGIPFTSFEDAMQREKVRLLECLKD